MGASNVVVDTNTIIEYFRSKDKLKTTLRKLPDETDLFLSSVSVYELHMGAPNEDKQRDVQKLTENFSILPFTEDVAKQAAIIYHQLKRKNQLIEFRDIFIAATCIVNNIPLVTANRKHFDRIEGLQLA